MKHCIAFLLLSLVFSISQAQLSYEKRIEFERKADYAGHDILEFGKYGLLMTSYNTEDAGDQTEWKYELINTDLDIVYEDTVMLHKKMYRDEEYISDDAYYCLYRAKKGAYTLVSIDLNDFSLYKVRGVMPKKTYFQDIAVLGDYAYFNASIKRSPILLAINWKNGERKSIPISIPGINPKKISLDHFQLLKQTNEIFLYIKVKIKSGVHDTYVLRLNENGEKESLFNMNKNIADNLVTITAFPLPNGNYIFSGTFSTNAQYSSVGIFFCEANDNDIEYIKFYKYLDLENFLNYLPEKRQEKIEKKKKKRNAKGKEYDLNYMITMHDIIPIDKGYILLGEAYYATYRTESYTTTQTINGVTTTTTQYRSVFDGYQYTHAFIARFNKTGDIEWSECFELWDTYKTFYPKKHISVQEHNTASVKLVYPSSNRIIFKEIGIDGEIIHDQSSDEIESQYDDKEIRYTLSSLDYWYDNYFVSYGSQKIKEKDNGKKTKKYIFYVTKVKFQ